MNAGWNQKTVYKENDKSVGRSVGTEPNQTGTSLDQGVLEKA